MMRVVDNDNDNGNDNDNDNYKKRTSLPLIPQNRSNNDCTACSQKASAYLSASSSVEGLSIVMESILSQVPASRIFCAWPYRIVLYRIVSYGIGSS